MATTLGDEVRVRVTIDREMPELFARLANSKRQAREVVYLLRLGMQMEMMLSGKAALMGPGVTLPMASSGAASVGATAGETGKQTGPGKVQERSEPTVEGFAVETGLTADYFAGAPVHYSD